MTQSLILFLSLCAACAFLVAFIVIYPWMTGSKSDDNRLMSVNVQTFYERLAELDSDKAAGVIDETFYDAQVLSLKRQLLAAQTATPMVLPASIKSRFIVLLWVPILAGMAYFLVGDRTAVFKLWQAQDTVGQVADDLLTGKIDVPPQWAIEDSSALISAMQTNVHHNAHDPNRWMRLSELFMSLQAPPQVLEALARAYRLNPNDEGIAATYAQVSFFANEGRLDETARSVVTQILTNNPNHEGALMLMAMGDTRAGNYAAAKAWTARLRTLIAAKSGDHSAALTSLDELAATIDAQAQKAAMGVTVNVRVDSSLLPKIQDTDVLFVAITEAAGGPPYAVKRIPVSQIKEGTVQLNLSSLDAMMPERTLQVARDNRAQLIVTARISKSGNAMSQSQDLSANPVPLAQTAQSADLFINQIVP